MKKLMIFAVAICLLSPLKAQDNVPELKEQDPTIAIAIVPQSFAYNIAELNLDLRLAERQWLTIAPLFQFDSNDNYYNDATSAIKNGIGLGLNYRYFPLTPRAKQYSDGKGPFIAVGLRGLTTSYEYTDNSLSPYGGILPAPTIYKERASQLGINLNIGYALRFFDILFVEGYMGVGTRYSNYEYDAAKGLNLGAYSGDTGYSGFCFTGGLRFGIFLNRYTRN